MATPIYMRDIKPELRNDGHFGKGTEQIMKEAENQGTEVVIGYYLDKPKIQE